MKKQLLHKAAVLSDIHIPIHDEAALASFLQAIEDAHVDSIFLDGDVLDCHAVSRFPKTATQRPDFEEELSAGRDFVRDLRKRFSKAEIVYVEGNHEYRVRRMFQSQPDKAGYDWIEKYAHLRRTLELDKLNIVWVEHPGVAGQMRIKYGDCLIGHWDIARSGSSRTAAGLMSKYPGKKIVQGHVHHAAAIHQHALDVDVWGLENPCVTPIHEVDYCLDPNWQQGFTLLYNNNGIVHYQQSVVDQNDRSFICEGRLYKIEEAKSYLKKLGCIEV